MLVIRNIFQKLHIKYLKYGAERFKILMNVCFFSA